MRPSPVITAALLVLTASVLAPLATAHAAPPARAFETRVLHDHNDDSLLVLAGKHGFDAIALDVREVHTPDGAPALALRLLLNGGCDDTLSDPCGTLSHAIQFLADGNPVEVVLSTTDGGATWSVSPAGLATAPAEIGDGTRFAIEAWVPFAELGIAVFSELTDWFVAGAWEGQVADNMPEGVVPGTPDPLGAAYQLAAYSVRSPEAYVRLAAAVGQSAVEPGTTFDILLDNPVPLEQNVTLQITGATPATLTVPVAARFQKAITLAADGNAEAVTVSATTPLGGHAFLRLPTAAATDGRLRSPEILPGESWQHTFAEAGVVEYRNHNAAAHQGRITIAVPGEGHTPTTHDVRYDGGFHPPALNVSAGDTVRFLNHGTEPLVVVGTRAAGHDDADHHGDEAEEADKGLPGPALALLVAAMAAIAVARRRND